MAGTAAAVWCTYRLIATTAVGGRDGCCLRRGDAQPERARPVGSGDGGAGGPLRPHGSDVAAPRPRRAGVRDRGVRRRPWVVYNLGRFEEPVVLSHGDGNVLSGSNCDATYHGTLLGFHNGFCGFIEDLPGRRTPWKPRRGGGPLSITSAITSTACLWSSPPGSAARGAYGQVQMARIASGRRAGRWWHRWRAGHVLGPRAPCGTGRSFGQALASRSGPWSPSS